MPLVLVVLAAMARAPAPAAAQGPCATPGCGGAPRLETGVSQELTAAGLNALLGGVAAAATRIVRGEPIGDALWKGALGGGVVYAGKRVAVEGFDGAGLAGRELASVGGSMVRNAGAGRGLLEELVLPVGPVRLYVSRHEGLRPRIDVGTVLASASFVLAYGARPDLGESLSAGALVFRGAAPAPGMAAAGALVLWDRDRIPADEGPRLKAHERVHILQYDQMFLAWDEAVERWLVGRSGPSHGLLRHLDFGALTLGLRAGIGAAMPYADRPWEREAYLLSQTAHPIIGDARPHTH